MLARFDEETIRKAISSPSDLENMLMNTKGGQDREYYAETRSNADFYFLLFVVFVNFGLTITVSENAYTLCRKNS